MVIIDTVGMMTSGIKSINLMVPFSFIRRIMRVIIKNNNFVNRIDIKRILLNWFSKKVTWFPDNLAIKSVVNVEMIAIIPIVNADTNIVCSIEPCKKIQQNIILINICNRLA